MARIARTVILRVRVTPKENASIQMAAKRLHLSASDVLRAAADIFCREATK